MGRVYLEHSSTAVLPAIAKSAPKVIIHYAEVVNIYAAADVVVG